MTCLCLTKKDFDTLERLVLDAYYKELGMLVTLERDEAECLKACRTQRKEVEYLDRLFSRLRTERFECVPSDEVQS